MIDPSATVARPGSAPPTIASRREVVLWIVLIVAATIAVYAPTIGHEFVWDDLEQVVDNTYLRDWSHASAFWQQDVLGSSRDNTERSNYYRPLFFTQYLVIYQLFGPDPARWHALAIALHLVAAFAAWFCARGLGAPTRVAALGALLFSLHPAHGESVAWVAAAFNDPPASALLLFAIAFHLRAKASPSGRRAWPWSVAAWVAYVAALLIKESALALLALVPLVELYTMRDRWRWSRAWAFAVFAVLGLGLLGLELAAPAVRDGRPLVSLSIALGVLAAGAVATRALRPEAAWRRDVEDVIATYAPYLAITFGWIAVRKLAIGTGLGVYSGAVSTADWLATIPSLVWVYVRFLLWPWGYSPSYPVRYVDGMSAAVVVAGAGLVALVLALVWVARRAPLAGLAAGWFFACLAPALNVRSFRPTYLVHQRYLYLAVFGLTLLLAWWIACRLAGRTRIVVAAALIITWSASLVTHNRHWSSDEALWRRIAEVDPDNPASFDWLGARAMRAGRLDEAESLFLRSIAADDGSPNGYRNLAVLLHQGRGQPEAALAPYRAALERFERQPGGEPLAVARAREGYAACLAATGQFEAALSIFLAQAEAPPYPAAAVRNAAVLLRRLGRTDELAGLLEGAVARNPSDTTLLSMLIDVRRWLGPAEAVPPLVERLRALSGDARGAGS